MNRERILKVADAIETTPIAGLGFNMSDFAIERGSAAANWLSGDFDKSGHNCGTVACIAGWAAAIKLREELEESTTDEEVVEILATHVWDIRYDAEEYLGLDNDTADALFFGEDSNVPLSEITQDSAVKTLRHLAETGKVEWNLLETKEDTK